MVVRMRRNRSQTAKRRSHHALGAMRTAKCECGALRRAHRACASCGKDGGRVVVDVVAREKREQRRAKRKEVELKRAGQYSEEKAEEKKEA